MSVSMIRSLTLHYVHVRTLHFEEVGKEWCEEERDSNLIVTCATRVKVGMTMCTVAVSKQILQTCQSPDPPDISHAVSQAY